MKVRLNNVFRFALVALIFIGAFGCSTDIRVTPLNGVYASGTEIKGVPFRAKERYRATLYRLVDGSYQALESNQTVVTLANQDQLYLLGLRGLPLSDSTVVVTLNSDNTLSSVRVDSESKGEEALTELSSQAKALSDANDARDTADKTVLSSSEDARLAALDARIAAVEAKRVLEALPTSADRTTAELALMRAELVANQKARRAELALPYPNAGL